MLKQETGLMIEAGRTSLGIELGSTRIKAVLIGEDFEVLASSSHTWENKLENGIWTYSMDDVWAGLQDAYKKLAGEVKEQHGVCLMKIGSIGVSAMMHGYLPFDKNGNQLAPFRTWRNTITQAAARELSESFNFNIPQRWSVAHVYNAILGKEAHVNSIAFLTTLAGYVHWKLTGEKVAGVGEASGMFPIDSNINNYDAAMLAKFNASAKAHGVKWNIEDILPRVLVAGENAGVLSKEGALLLDSAGYLEAGIPMCPPEGDAGTGMVATNAVAERSGNVSAGTSIFAMIVLEKAMQRTHAQIDMVTTPAGRPVAMVHCNNCSSDFDAWERLFEQLIGAVGIEIDRNAVYVAMYAEAMKGNVDGGGLLSYNYYSGEHITGFAEGRPLLVRLPQSEFTLGDFARTLLYSAIATLRLGMDILTGDEAVRVDVLQGHGGFFKLQQTGQTLMAGALNVPVSVMETAGEGGAWGIALLAAFMRQRQKDDKLEAFLSERVFNNATGITIMPRREDVRGFNKYLERYKNGFDIERTAVQNLV